MKVMKVIFSPRAEKELKKISKFDQIAVVSKIQSLKAGENIVSEKLSGYKDIFRFRVGHYRIVYKKFSDKIYIILIRHRKDVYKLLKDLIK